MATKVLALTGSIGSGKSTALKIFKELGAETISADELARELVQPGSDALEEIRERFGDEVISENGELIRKKLGEIVFSDHHAKNKLENILHPKIRKLSKERIQKLLSRSEAPEVIVYEIPLYFESNLEYPEITSSVLVYASRNTSISRVMKRENLGEKEVELRLNAQMDIEEKRKRADYVLDNSSEDLSSLYSQIEKLYRELKES